MLTINFSYRLTLWMKKTDSAKLTAKPHTLRRLPPTDEALDLNIMLGHLQGAHWQYSVTGEPPKFGFQEDPNNPTMLRPVMMPRETALAPKEVLRITKCNCTSEYFSPILKFYLLSDKTV